MSRRCRVEMLDPWPAATAITLSGYAPDGYHLTSEGQASYAAWIDDRVDAVVKALRNAR